MKKTNIYKYLGTNGVIESPIHLEDIYYIRLVELRADKGKVLTDKEVKEIIISNGKIGRETNIWLKPRRRYPISDTTKRFEKEIYERIMSCDE